MRELSRRRLLQWTGAGLGTGALAACGGGTSADRDHLTFWSHQGNQRKLQKSVFAKFARTRNGTRVEHTFRNAAEMGRAMQLARQSNQLPDIHSNAGLELPMPQQIAAGYVAPLELSDAALRRLRPHLVEGVHLLDGELYGIPQFDFRKYRAATWFNTEIIQRAGLDPNDPPRTYDAFRAHCRTVHKAGGAQTSGWIWNIGMPHRLQEQVLDLAQAAGFEGGHGQDGVLFRTGEFAYDSDPFLHVIEFLHALHRDGLLYAGSMSLTDETARATWATGAAGYYLDGPWNPGVIRESVPEFGGRMGVGPILVPEAGMPVRCYSPSDPPVFRISPGLPEARRRAANTLLGEYFTTHEYFVALASAMPMPTLDPTAVDQSDAYPPYKKLIGWMADSVFLAPQPIVRNPEVAKAQVEVQPVVPTLGDIVQGVFAGEVTDVRKALKDLSDAQNAHREEAVKAARAKGAEVDLDDFAFPDWTPGADYHTSRK